MNKQIIIKLYNGKLALCSIVGVQNGQNLNANPDGKYDFIVGVKSYTDWFYSPVTYPKQSYTLSDNANLFKYWRGIMKDVIING